MMVFIEASVEGKKDPSMRWESRYELKSVFALRNLNTKKISVLAEWLWKFPIYVNSSCHYLIKSKYEIQDNA